MQAESKRIAALTRSMTADRLSPFKDDKLKNAEISPFQAGSDIYCHADLIWIMPT